MKRLSYNIEAYYKKTKYRLENNIENLVNILEKENLKSIKKQLIVIKEEKEKK